MYLTAKATTGHPRRIDQHEEVEMLLETYIKQSEQKINEVMEMQQSVQITEEYLQVQLDKSRNQIMRLSLVLTIGAFGTNVGGLINPASATKFKKSLLFLSLLQGSLPRHLV